MKVFTDAGEEVTFDDIQNALDQLGDDGLAMQYAQAWDDLEQMIEDYFENLDEQQLKIDFKEKTYIPPVIPQKPKDPHSFEFSFEKRL